MQPHNIEQIKRSIFSRTLVALLAMGIVLVATILLPLHKDLKAKNDAEINFVVDARVVSVNQYLSKITNIAEQFTSRTQIRRKLIAFNNGEVTQDELVKFSHDKLLDAMKKSEEAVGITRLDITGNVALVVGRKLPTNFLSNFDSGLNRTTLNDPVTIEGELFIIVSTPILDRNQNKVGIDIVLFETHSLGGIIQDYSGLGVTGEVILAYTDKDGFESFFKMRRSYDSGVLEKIRDDFIAGQFDRDQSSHPACVTCIVTIRSIEHTGWHLLFLMEENELNAIISATTMRLLIIAVFIMVLGIIGIYFLTYPLLHSLAEELKERILAEKKVLQLNERLEGRVQERTRELATAKEEAEHANQAKSQFLSKMSHELRTPMNAILGFSQLLEMNLQDEKHKSSVREVITAGKHLLVLINEILDLSTIEAGKLELSMENCNLNSILDTCLSFTKPLAATRNIKIINNVNTTDNHTVHVDSTRFKQVMLNLLTNAIKYNNDKGTVTLSCEVIDANKLRISVSDTGNGLTEQQQQRMFKSFERLEEHKGIDGTGIGLVITKQLVELMGGMIGVESQPGQGSTFWVQVNLSEM